MRFIVQNFILNVSKIYIVRKMFLSLDEDELSPAKDSWTYKNNPGVPVEEFSYDGGDKSACAAHDVAHTENESLDVAFELLVGEHKYYGK